MTLSIIAYPLLFLFVCGATLMLSQLAPKIGLMAHPGEHRRHSHPTPLIGGIAILSGISMAAAVGMFSFPGMHWPIILIFIVGLLDDRFHLPSWSRFTAQAMALWMMICLLYTSDAADD